MNPRLALKMSETGFGLLAVLATMVVATISCQGPGREADSRGAPSAPPNPAGQNPTLASPGTGPGIPSEPEPIQISVELGPGEFHLADPRAGLDDLSSYTERLIVTFDGSQDGQPRKVVSTSTFWHTTSPSATQLTITGAGENGDGDPTFLAIVGEVAYAQGEDGNCRAAPIDLEGGGERLNLGLREPAVLLKAVFGAEEAGGETLDGAMANRYRFDQRALFEYGMTEAQGEFWVGADNGVLLKYRLTASGGPDFFDEGSEGVVTWEYDLTDINTTVQPAFPEGCQLDAPVMADASEILHLPHWLTYTTAAPFSEAAAFYQTELPRDGWALVSGPMASESSVFLEFTRGADTVGVFATARDGATQVDVVLYDPED